MWVKDSLIVQEKNQMDCDRFCEGIAIKMGRMNHYEMTDFRVDMIMWVDCIEGSDYYLMKDFSRIHDIIEEDILKECKKDAKFKRISMQVTTLLLNLSEFCQWQKSIPMHVC